MPAVAQKSFALVQSDFRFRPINVTAQTVRDVGKLVVRQANHASVGGRKFRIVSGNDRFAPRRFRKLTTVVDAAGYYRIRKHGLCRWNFF